MSFNKKGDWKWGEMFSLILVIIVVVVLLTGIPTFGKNTGNSLSCDSKNGVCRDKCDTGELGWYADPTRKCEKMEPSKTCCMPNPNAQQGTVKDTECQGQPVGKVCSTQSGTYYVCNEQSQCITKCEFCSTHAAHDLCKKTASGVDFTSSFVCGCGQKECEDLRKTGKCTKSGVGGFCYSGAYCCER